MDDYSTLNITDFSRTLHLFYAFFGICKIFIANCCIYACLFVYTFVSKLISNKFRAAVGNPYGSVSRSLFVTDVFRVISSDKKISNIEKLILLL